MNVRGNSFGGLADIAQVWLMVLIERRRDTDDQGIHILGVGVLIGGPKAFGSGGGNLSLWYAIDIGPAVVQGLNFFGIDIEPGHGKAGFIEEESQRQSDVPETDDSYFCGMGMNASQQRLERLRTGTSC